MIEAVRYDENCSRASEPASSAAPDWQEAIDQRLSRASLVAMRRHRFDIHVG